MKYGVGKGLPAHLGPKVTKIVLMTRNEWPLIRSWVLYHGKIFGYPNLYILDGSDDERVLGFLQSLDAHGVTVIQGLNSLNTIDEEINTLMKNLQHSCDFLLKMDTDEFLILIGTNDLPAPHSEIPVYLNQLQTTGSLLRLGYDMMSSPSQALCCRNISDVTTNTNFQAPRHNPALKVLLNAWTFASVNLGAHTGVTLSEFAHFPARITRLGIAHFHWLCYDQVQINNRKALLSHGFLKANVADRLQIGLLRHRVGGTSGHKAVSYLQHLEDPVRSRKDYYSDGSHNEHKWHVRTRAFLNWSDIAEVVHAESLRFGQEVVFDCEVAARRYVEEFSDQLPGVTERTAWEHFVSRGRKEGLLWPGELCSGMC